MLNEYCFWSSQERSFTWGKYKLCYKLWFVDLEQSFFLQPYFTPFPSKFPGIHKTFIHPFHMYSGRSILALGLIFIEWVFRAKHSASLASNHKMPLTFFLHGNSQKHGFYPFPKFSWQTLHLPLPPSLRINYRVKMQ